MIAQPAFWETYALRKGVITTVQINLGNRCNQACSHCHIEASPNGTDNMETATARKVLEKLLVEEIESIEFTGGTPELNPNFEMFVEELSAHDRRVTVRTSLTVLDMREHAHFIDLYGKHGVKVVASLPGAVRDLTDRQRGKGVFDTSIRVLKKLNEVGYGGDRLFLDLVHNPVGDCLPPGQSRLEREYKELLKDRYGIRFNNLVTIANAPIRRFRRYLGNEGKLDGYIRALVDNFNGNTLDGVMCKHMISVDYQGYVHDCDFNLALGIRIKGCEDRKFWELDFENVNAEITCDEHCYACTAGRGSSCHGALIKDGSDATYVKENVRKYYGEELTGTADLKTSACCTSGSLPGHIQEVLPSIAEEIKERYYGCGSPVPLVLEGRTVLDLGCGTGRDSYVVSKLVGEDGFVYGLDMTEAQIGIAMKYVEEQTRRFGYSRPNIKFIYDTIENAGSHFPDESLDLVISNCVINLLPQKKKVFSDIFRMLKPGGEIYFSDVFAGRRVPARFMDDPVLHGECLAGAMYREDFRRMLRDLGCPDYRVVEKRRISLEDPEIEEKVGMIDFYSMTVRVFKLSGLEDICEDYGQSAVYMGSVPGHPHRFVLDDHHTFITGKPMLVCGNTASMLEETRFAPHFRVTGDRSVHYGPFDCSAADDQTREESGGCKGGACC